MEPAWEFLRMEALLYPVSPICAALRPQVVVEACEGSRARHQHGAIRRTIATAAAGYRALPVASHTGCRQLPCSQNQEFCADRLYFALYRGARPRHGIGVAGVGVSACVRQFQCRVSAVAVLQTA